MKITWGPIGGVAIEDMGVRHKEIPADQPLPFANGWIAGLLTFPFTLDTNPEKQKENEIKKQVGLRLHCAGGPVGKEQERKLLVVYVLFFCIILLTTFESSLICFTLCTHLGVMQYYLQKNNETLTVTL